MAPRSHGSARTSGSTVLQGPARPRVQTPRRGGSGPTRPRPAAWTCSVRPVAPQPLLPRAASPALWSPCAHPQHGPAHSHPTGPSRTVGATARWHYALASCVTGTPQRPQLCSGPARRRVHKRHADGSQPASCSQRAPARAPAAPAHAQHTRPQTSRPVAPPPLSCSPPLPTLQRLRLRRADSSAVTPLVCTIRTQLHSRTRGPGLWERG